MRRIGSVVERQKKLVLRADGLPNQPRCTGVLKLAFRRSCDARPSAFCTLLYCALRGKLVSKS